MRRLQLMLAGALALLVVVIFGQVFWFDFVGLDDPDYVQHNPHVLGGLTWSSFTWAFTSFHAMNWHPLTWLSHMLDVELFGVSPGGPHMVNVLLHAANSVLLFAWLSAVTGKVWRGALVAALFAAHPLHVESVAWISERKDVLSTLFMLLTLCAWISWTRDRRRGSYLLALVLLAAALLAKPMPVTLPFVLLLCDAWPLHRGCQGGIAWRTLVLEKLPFFALSIGSSIVTWFAQSQGATSALADVSPAERVANAAVAYLTYLTHTFWPANLAVFYPHPALNNESHPVWKVVLACVVIVVVSIVAWHGRRKRPWLAWSWCWFLGTLVPVIGLAQVGQQAWADRYAYVPLIGVFTACVWGASELLTGLRISARVGAVASVALLVALSSAAWAQTRHWSNGVRLYEHCVDVVPRCAVAWAALGDARLDAGDAEGTLTAYRQALALDDRSVRATLGLGIVLARSGRGHEAVPHLERAVRLAPHDASAWYNLGAARGNAGRHREAALAFEEAVRLAPEDEQSLAGLYVARRTLGDKAGALEILGRLARVNPNLAAQLQALVER